METQYKVLEFKFMDKNDNFENRYPHWSRKYEYPTVLHFCKQLLSNNAKIHNTSWGWDTEHHQKFKSELENAFGSENVLSTDIKSSNIPNTEIYDITHFPPEKYQKAFDCVLNISTVEEVNFDHIEILKNLLAQVKDNGYLIITFDYPGMQLEKLENFLNMKIKDTEYGRIYHDEWKLYVGLLIIQKIK